MKSAHKTFHSMSKEEKRYPYDYWVTHIISRNDPCLTFCVCLFFKWWFRFSNRQRQGVFIGSVCACQPGSGLLSWDQTHPGWSLLEFSSNHHHFSSCDINLASATQWSFLMHSNCRAHFTRSQFEICMKNGGVSWWRGFAIKRQANEIEILVSGPGFGSEGTHARAWNTNGKIMTQTGKNFGKIIKDPKLYEAR